MLKRKVSKASKKRGRGRPPVEVKKVPFQVMLDPRYIEYFRKTAKAKKVEAQVLARMALNAFVPDPFNPMSDGPKFAISLLKKPPKPAS